MRRTMLLILLLALLLALPCAHADRRSAEAALSLQGFDEAVLEELDRVAGALSGSISYGDSLEAEVSEASLLCGELIARTLDELRADVEYFDGGFVSYEDELTIELWRSGDELFCAAGIRSASRRASGHRPDASASIRIDDDSGLYQNISCAADSINDTVVPAGEIFSFNDCVGPRLEDYGYVTAVSGSGEAVMGGGAEQVASAIWLASKQLDDVVVVEKSTYGSDYSLDYVSSSNDAIFVDDRTDFSFRNVSDAPLRICTSVSGDELRCEIYMD